MKKFSVIKEDLASSVVISDDYMDAQNELVEIVKNSTNNDDSKLQLDTIKSYIEDSDTTIVGLVNDSDVYDFYIKYRNEIDKVLSDIEHFNISPDEIGSTSSLYDYVVVSTKISIQELFKMMTDIK